ncbi:G-type lectin S-receptor-like serine/threonine-protein kinase RLK1 [Spinacia oleracea]|uniref:Receptor-like serine/threonine-protein kinase n=1 Tax=Spinacia oleracea TaxID=3562 RepID=A0A9R0K9B6_SPIOL|nr:G-type lectin S-receptor-like serine/threonine-protein kinase RLK1 [Spinacia oleracea]XP_056699572.1 G-type lectin S-receptor-like serine/threonine-protein kinase RLK1 [Spinacia oleracea]
MACLLSYIIFFLTQTVLLLSPTAAQNTGNIPVGRSLVAATNGSSWLSPSGDFAFGFHQLPNTRNLFLLSIWFAKIPDTVVWSANEGNPVPQGSSVQITANEGLVLSDPQGNNLWNTSNELSGVGGGVSYGFINDTGNFALKRSSNDNPVWQSFDHPTDTLLPGMSLGSNEAISSRLSETNFTTGRFQYRLTSDGTMALNATDLTTGYAYEAYHISDISNAGHTQRFVYNESGYMYILRKDGSMYNMLPENYTPSKDYYQRFILAFDGILMLYSAPKTSVTDGWSLFQITPRNMCIERAMRNLGTGICGSNSICSLNADKRPVCTCPLGYSRLDPDDQFGRCKPNFKLQSCEGNAAEISMKDEYNLVRLTNTDFTYNDYERVSSNNEEDCKNACLKDCYCAAASFQLFGDNSGCWKKKAPLFNGRTDSSVTDGFWIKVRKANISNDPLNPYVNFPPLTAKNKTKALNKVLIGGSVSVNILLLTAIGLGIFFTYHKKQLKGFDEVQRKTLRAYSKVHYFSYQELNEATNGFQEELGRGSFGIVYKGMISGGGLSTFVAVKKLDRISGDTDKEFKTEVNVIGQTHHKNLVQLVGFCKEEDQRLLVYEYMSNGSLADYIFRDSKPSWIERVLIAQGTAKGLLYLHEECSTQIIHCDIKPQNILLDEYQNARISDFGLAKLLILNQTQTNTAVRGTKGYVAPEWFRNKPVTVKVDVYSFGVLLLEIICCRKSVCMDLFEGEGAILTDWAFDCYQSNRLNSLVNDDMEAITDMIRLKKFVMVALWCIQEDPSVRPTMRTVTQMLEGLAEVPDNLPCPSSFSVTTQY